MDVMNLIESLFRWFHVFFGILWIGLLYFFNWVNAVFAPTMDAETKKKVVPELMPRALFWFRWGAAFTWITGVFLLLLVFYHGGAAFAGGVRHFTAPMLLMIVLVFVAPFIYDAIYKGPLKDPSTGFWAGLVIVFVVVLLLDRWAAFSYRGTAIHLGTMLGTIMAFNVWFRIWPSQRTIITATKNGTAPDAAIVALAGTRSKHNTYMSAPLVFMMISQHATWAASATPISLTIIVAVGWATAYHIYDRAKNVKGF
jgi:uncharacterized membrane protein